MDSAPERQVLWREWTRDVERVGVGTEVHWVVVRRAEPVRTTVLLGITTPSIARSSSTTRRENCTGPSKRSSSSTAFAIEVGLVAQPRQLIGMAEQRERAVADEVHRRLVAGEVEQGDLVDELLGERRSPSSSIARSALSRSSAGWARFHSITASTWAAIASDAAMSLGSSSGALSGSRVSVSVCDNSRSRSRSPSGIPSSSEITTKGSGNARSVMTSKTPSRFAGADLGRAVEELVDELLDASAERLDAAGREAPSPASRRRRV